mgnify:CR=1 FL=1
MIIDSLTHVTPDGRWFRRAEVDASEDRLLRQMDDSGVERAVVVALAEHIANEFVLGVCQRHADRLVPGGSFNPAAWPDEAEAATQFRAQLKSSPFPLIKLHPRLNRYDPLDPRCLAILRELMTWPARPAIWIDSLFYFNGGTLTRPVVDTVQFLGSSFPEIYFVVLHCGGSWALQVAEAVRDCPNVFLDLSFTAHRYAGSSLELDLKYLVETFDRRLLFGSDFPEVGIDEALVDFHRLSHSAAPEKVANVLGKNLQTILSRLPSN